MSTAYLFTVEGIPAPQGSKTYVGNGRMIESSKKVAPWRKAVTLAILEKGFESQLQGALWISVVFYMPRPKSHFTTGGLKSNAPETHTKIPDLDKLVRSTLDAITQSGLIVDDSQFVCIYATKKYAHPTTPGAIIRMSEAVTPDENSE